MINKHNDIAFDKISSLSMLDDLSDIYENRITQAKRSLTLLDNVKKFVDAGKRIPFVDWCMLAQADDEALITKADPFIAPMIIERIVIPGSEAHLKSDNSGIEISINGVKLLMEAITDNVVTNGIVAWDEIRIHRPDILHVLYAPDNEESKKVLNDLVKYGFFLTND